MYFEIWKNFNVHKIEYALFAWHCDTTTMQEVSCSSMQIMTWFRRSIVVRFRHDVWAMFAKGGAIACEHDLHAPFWLLHYEPGSWRSTRVRSKNTLYFSLLNFWWVTFTRFIQLLSLTEIETTNFFWKTVGNFFRNK